MTERREAGGTPMRLRSSEAMGVGSPGGPIGDDPADPAATFHRSLRDRLFERRVVVLTGRLDHEAAGRAAVELMTLDADGDDPIRLQLGCDDGELDAALSLMDVVELVGVPVEVLCIGTVGGAAAGVLAVVDRRLGTATTGIRLRDPGDSYCGSARDQERWAAFRAERWRTFCGRISASTGRPLEKVDEDFSGGRFLNAEQAVHYGLLDEIVGQAPTGRRSPFGSRPGT